ncbi:hypothetical protein [uncultured Ferrovibrio sp.]|jgi:ElaB/YqjD/DUF883 family membrane-anchored ribosome-binding protein|uniref:hypothetical protein n=1 Tax=uncultured Ferrovibrio sp. TaxID=1576913 RepID=UPI00262656D0|nr:hypothetical protein [uncultured Ferrovibrio sp.]
MTAQDRVNEDITELRAQVSDLGNQLNSVIERARKEGGSIAQAELSQLQDRLQKLMTDVRDRGREALSSAENTVREHPGASLLTAFAAGALVALLLRR